MQVRIGEIRVRFKGVPKRLVQESMDGIGDEILNLLAQQYTPGGFARFHTYNIEAVDAGTIECQKGACPDEIRSTIAGRIAGLVEARIR
jgi:hypothetical protein